MRRLHPPRSQLVALVHGGAPAIGEPAARLHPQLAGIQAPVLLIPWALRPDGALEEVSITIVNPIADWHLVLLNKCGHWPVEKPAE
jgi:hypothetical protein